MKRRYVWFAAGLCVAWGAACSSEPQVVAIAPEQVTERRDFVEASRKRALGEACDDTGEAGCRDRVCIKVHGAVGSGRVCSRTCRAGQPEPAGFSCSQIYPADDAWFLLPLRAATLLADGGVR